MFPEPVLTFAPAEEQLVSRLVGFGVEEGKARSLVKRHREATEAQIAAYPYREVGKPRKNAAGWIIAAIEGNYTLPVAYLEEQEKKRQAVKAKEQSSAVEGCRLCDQNGWRRVSTPEYPNGAMKRCSHDPKKESKYPDAERHSTLALWLALLRASSMRLCISSRSSTPASSLLRLSLTPASRATPPTIYV